ncbi:hypothetical protein ACFQ9X_21020 [Catenulispora yoronensis]
MQVEQVAAVGGAGGRQLQGRAAAEHGVPGGHVRPDRPGDGGGEAGALFLDAGRRRPARNGAEPGGKFFALLTGHEGASTMREWRNGGPRR